MPCSIAAASSSAACASLERRHDQEHAVGAEGAGFDDLIGIEHEVLAQRRQIDGSAGGGEILVAALEIGLVGQDRQAGGAAALVGAGEGDRIEIGADEAACSATPS